MAIIEKRNNTYRIRVSRGINGNGKREFYSMNWKPPEGITNHQLQKELKLVAADFEIKCRDGAISSEENLKLKDFCKTYLDIQRDNLAPRTYEYYSNLIYDLIIPELGNYKLCDLKPIHVQKFINNIKNNPKRDGSSPSPSTVKGKVACLQSIMHLAVKLGVISSNPASPERVNLPKAIVPKVEIFTKETASQMIKCLSNEPIEMQCLIHIAIASGARRGEIVGLKFSDIDYERNIITIRRSAYKVTGEEIGIKPPKDNEVRTVTVYQEVIDLISKLREEKAKQQQVLGSAWRGDDWLFTKADGSIMHPQTPSKLWAKFLKRNNLPHRKFHSLRHTSATLLLSSGSNIGQVKDRLGHSSIRTTQIYLHSLQEADEQAAKMLQTILIPNSPSIQSE